MEVLFVSVVLVAISGASGFYAIAIFITFKNRPTCSTYLFLRFLNSTHLYNPGSLPFPVAARHTTPSR